MRWALLSFAAGAAFATPATAEELAFGQAPVSDTELADQRGGFALPGGIDVSIAVQSETRVNGVLLLRSVFVADRGPPTLTVFARTGDAQSALPGTGQSSSNPNATSNFLPGVGAGVGATSSSVSFGNAVTSSIGDEPEGLSKIDLVSGGVAVEAAGGTVRLDRSGALNQVVLSQETLDVRHLVGQAYGTIAANRGNDVSVETSTIINLDLKNVTPLNMGSALFRAEALGLDAAAALGRR
ncbi:MAG TPA: hypothetical protein VF628_02090 [Allosphingosinicella sp.]|jgi:hypothetical protein